MSSQVIRYPLEPWLDLTEALGESVLLSLTIGYDGGVYVLAADPPYQIGTTGAIKPVATQKSLNYIVLQIHNWGINRIPIDGQGGLYYLVNPLPDDQILVVGSRDRDYQVSANSHIFSEDGQYSHSIFLGDYWADVQTTADGCIWAGYRDEAYSNDVHGLVKWGLQGEQLYICRDRDLFHCYALNVAARGEIWHYYHGDFQLVHLKNERETNYWDVPIKGSSAFAVWRHLAVFEGGYDRHNEYCLLELGDNHTMKELGWFVFVDGDGEVIQPECRAMRDSTIVIFQGTTLYRLNANDLNDV